MLEGDVLHELQRPDQQAARVPRRISDSISGGEEARGLSSLGLVEVDHDAEAGVSIRITPMGSTLAQTMRL